jgi:S-adenosylmethionine decarboxylase
MLKPHHQTVDLKYCTLGLDNTEDIKDFLEYSVKLMKLTQIGEPHIHQFDDKPPNNGITGSLILSESLISIHTYPKEQCVYIDLFSCKPFYTSNLINYCKWFFNGQLACTRYVTRYIYDNINNDNRPH